jgi:molybdopterin/thiamine biosynthesis adenylyltransferase
MDEITISRPFYYGVFMLRLENNVEIYRAQNGPNVTFVKRGIGQILEFNMDQDGQTFLETITSEGSINIVDKKFDAIISDLQDLNLITSRSLDFEKDANRSQSQWFRDWNLSPQESTEKIANAKVAIVGVGGIGSWISLQLSAIGIKNITLIDGDVVDESNLNKQFFTINDVGSSKVECLSKELKLRFPNLVTTSHKAFISNDEDCEKYLNASDFILIAADYPTRSQVSSVIGRWCLKREKVHFICGGYSGHTSALGLTVIPGVTPCWDCYQTNVDNQLGHLINKNYLKSSGAKIGSSFLPLVMLAASSTAFEVARTILGIPPAFGSKQYDLDPKKWDLKTQNFNASSNCQFCKHLS